jgi:hypothetical protein
MKRKRYAMLHVVKVLSAILLLLKVTPARALLGDDNYLSSYQIGHSTFCGASSAPH